MPEKQSKFLVIGYQNRKRQAFSLIADDSKTALANVIELHGNVEQPSIYEIEDLYVILAS